MSEEKKRRLTITVFTYNRISCLACLLTSLIFQTFKDWNLIICDDCSRDKIKGDELIEKLLCHLKYLGHTVEIRRNEVNMGIARSRNKIVPTLETELVFDCNDDHILESDCLEKMVACFDDPKVGAVGAASPFLGFFGNSGRWSRKGYKGMKVNNIYMVDGKLNITRDVDYLYTKFKEPIEAGHLSQAMYRRELWEPSIEEYTNIGFTEETDLTLKIRKKGYKLLFHPQAISWHVQRLYGGIREKCRSKNDGWIAEIDKQKEHDMDVFIENWGEWIKENPKI